MGQWGARRRPEWVVGVYFVILGLGFGSWATRIPDVAARVGTDTGGLGAALFALALGSLIGMPVAGIVATRVGPYRSTVLFGCMFAVSVTLPGVVTNLPALAAVLVVMGAANGALGVAMNDAATATERHSGVGLVSKCHGVFSVGGLLGACIGAVAAGTDLSPAVHLASISAILLIAALAAARALVGLDSDERVSDSDRAPLFVRPSRAALPFAIMAFCALFAEGSVTDWSAVFLRDVLSAVGFTAATGYVLFTVAMAGGRLAGDAIIDKLGQLRTLIGAAVSGGLGAAVVAASPVVPVALMGFAGWVSACRSRCPRCIEVCRGSIRRAPRCIAAVSTLGYFGFLVGPPAIGFVGHATSLRVSMAVVTGCLACLAAAVAFGRSARNAPAVPAHPS